jgi:hypothetical protein
VRPGSPHVLVCGTLDIFGVSRRWLGVLSRGGREGQKVFWAGGSVGLRASALILGIGRAAGSHEGHCRFCFCQRLDCFATLRR